jgi:hypothetical protein
MISNAKSSKTFKSWSILSRPSKKNSPINKTKNKINRKLCTSTSGIMHLPSQKNSSKLEKRKHSASTKSNKEKETEPKLKLILKKSFLNFHIILLNFWNQSSKKDSKNLSPAKDVHMTTARIITWEHQKISFNK